MDKIPVKIIEVTSPSGDMKKGVMLDSSYYFPMKKDMRGKIKKFESDYFDLVDGATRLFYGGNSKKKRRDIPSTTFWRLGAMLRRFHDRASSKFHITNYADSLQRDFGLTEPYIRELIAFSREFKLSEVSDNVPMAIYRALIWKRNQLYGLGLFEREKRKLVERGKTKRFIGRENYKRELKESIGKHMQKTGSV